MACGESVDMAYSASTFIKFTGLKRTYQGHFIAESQLDTEMNKSKSQQESKRGRGIMRGSKSVSGSATEGLIASYDF